MREQKFKRVGKRALPIPPLGRLVGGRICLSLTESANGTVKVGSVCVPLKNGHAYLEPSRLGVGVHPIVFCIGDTRIEADALRVEKQHAELVEPSRDSVAEDRLALYALKEKLDEQIEAIHRLDKAVFNTTIF